MVVGVNQKRLSFVIVEIQIKFRLVFDKFKMVSVLVYKFNREKEKFFFGK